MNCARPLAAVLFVFLAGCSRHDAPAPSDGYRYPEQILTATERREESSAKIARLTEWMRQRNHEGVLISTPANFAWLTAGGDNRVQGYPCGECLAQLFFSRDGRKVLIAPAGDALRIAREELADIDYELHEVPPCDAGKVEEAAAQVAQGKPLAEDRPEAPFAAELSALRVPLTDSEMRKYRWLGKRCGEVLDRVCRTIQPGMTERGIGALLSEGLVRHAIMPQQIVVAADARGSRYGAVPPSEKAKVEKMVLAGFSAARWGLVVSVVRQVHFGPLPEDSKRASQAASAVTAGYWARTLPGATVASIHAAAVQDYERLGFPLASMSAMQGGAIGYGRDWFACAGSREVINSAQAFAWRAFVSPVATEDSMLVVGDQLEVLTEIRGWPIKEHKVLGRVYRTPAILVR